MEFLPKSYERYSAALRVYLQNRYLKDNGNNFPYRFLRRVLIFEILTTQKQNTPTALSSFCDNVISSAQIELMKKGYFFECEIMGDAISTIDRRALTAILCEFALKCAKNKTTLKIIINKDKLCLIFKGLKPTSTLSRLLNYVNAVKFYVQSEQKNAVYISLESTELTPVPHKKIWQYINDPLSPIKAYLD